MAVHEKIQITILLELNLGIRAKPATFVSRTVRPAGVGAAVGKSAGQVGVDHAKRFNGHGTPHDRANHSVSAIFAIAEPVAMLNAHVPAREVACPRAYDVVHADILTEHLTAPAIMVAGDPENIDARVFELSQRRQCAKAPT